MTMILFECMMVLSLCATVSTVQSEKWLRITVWIWLSVLERNEAQALIEC
jgi:hypothetical protein